MYFWTSASILSHDQPTHLPTHSVFKGLKQKLGLDRVKVIITGSAPIASNVMNFLRAAFGCPVLEGYGQTESGGVATVTLPGDFSVGHVGVPAPSNEIALFDVPEMGYMSDDTEHSGEPVRGRGEICFRGPNVFAGYYKMPEKVRHAGFCVKAMYRVYVTYSHADRVNY